LIQYYRFCCKIRIADEKAPEVPGATLIAAEEGDVADIHARFADARDGHFSDWFNETPALKAHVMAVRVRHFSAETSNLGERLIPTASAILYTGRDRQVLYRWEREGRITRYGTAREALWDVFELPARRNDGALPHPDPPLRKKSSPKG
jgi:hypothetical protein